MVNYNFYAELDESKKIEYDRMLYSNYILLRSDEFIFIESDENNTDHISISWIHSIKSYIKLLGLDEKTYPQGSFSSNRLYYQALKNYHNNKFPKDKDFSLLLEGIKSFLTLRRDDSAINRSLLFGSCFKITKSLGTREPIQYRTVDVSIRHSAAALWILFSETTNRFSTMLLQSLEQFVEKVNFYLSKNFDWSSDHYKHLTLATIINLCNLVINKNIDNKYIDSLSKIRRISEQYILSKECLAQEIDGRFSWIVPPIKSSELSRYDYFLNFCSLVQVPHLLADERCQALLENMLENKIKTEYGYGIPIHSISNFSDIKTLKPDFGATASALYLLWYCLENKLGNERWHKYCEEYFDILLNFCLNTYSKHEFYTFLILENISKVLLLPRFNFSAADKKKNREYIHQIRKTINYEVIDHKGRFERSLDNIRIPNEYEHIKKIIKRWEISKYWKDQKAWQYDPSYSRLGEFMGGFFTGAVKALSS